MTYKERLIERENQYLLVRRQRKVANVKEDVECNADYLLDNGVLAPPCKIGDTVYVNIQYMLPDGSCRTEGPVVGQVCSMYFDKDGNEIEIEGDDPYFEKASIYRSSADFGNNVFLTKEEAEKAIEQQTKDKDSGVSRMKELAIKRELNEDTRKQGLFIDGVVYSLHITNHGEAIITDNTDYSHIYAIHSLDFYNLLTR